MGASKRIRAEKLKEARREKVYAILRDCPTSPRKMRLVIDLIRGKEVSSALDILKYTQKESAKRVEKLLLSAINNWEQKKDSSALEANLVYVKEAYVDQGRTLKRLRPAPQGRAYRIRKRSNHVTIVLDSVNSEEKQD